MEAQGDRGADRVGGGAGAADTADADGKHGVVLLRSGAGAVAGMGGHQSSERSSRQEYSAAAGGSGRRRGADGPRAGGPRGGGGARERAGAAGARRWACPLWVDDTPG